MYLLTFDGLIVGAENVGYCFALLRAFIHILMANDEVLTAMNYH